MDCLQIFKDEITNGNCSMGTTGCDAREVSWRMMGINNEKLIRFLSKTIILSQLFVFLGSLLMVFLKFSGSFFKYRNRKECPSIKNGDRFFLVFTPLFKERLTKTDLLLEDNPTYWIIGPNVKGKIELSADVNTIKWEDYIKTEDLFEAFYQTLSICWYYLIKTRVIFPAYRYWDFCLVALSLEKITTDAEIFFSNQSDRWALLFDKLPSKKKNLLQHGIDLDYGEKFVKLKKIDSFYAMSKKSWQNSYKYLLDCNPALYIMKPTIELYNIESLKNKVSVLLISNALLYADIEKEIIESLKDFPVQLFVKKHPLVVNDSDYLDMRSKYGFSYLTDRRFPRVDYVISYESTLAYEYMNYDIPVFVYNLEKDIDIEQIQREIMELQK